MTYPEAIDFLYGLRLHGLKLGLENTHRLAVLAGSPQVQLRFIHVAGTNGKGSTCAMLEGIYRAAGLRVGMFTSPHLISFRERIQVNRTWISTEAVVRLVTAMQGWLTAFPQEHPPTFFEVVTVMAMLHFVDQGCDLVMWETGMGGRLDATNIVVPEVSVITNIQFDHQQWLGTTREVIAVEKAGIIKPRVPVLTSADDPEALEVIRSRAAELQAPLTVVNSEIEGGGLPPGWSCPLAGAHQRTNAALSLATVRVLRARVPVDEAVVRLGLASVQWSGRMQVIQLEGGGRLLLDGAHNLAGMGALLAALAQGYPGCRPAFVLGMMEDKDGAAMSALVARAAARVVLVPIRSERSVAPEELAAACAREDRGLAVETASSLEGALERTATESFVVVAGSLYLVGEALELLGLMPAEAVSERGLNDWSPGKMPR